MWHIMIDLWCMMFVAYGVRFSTLWYHEWIAEQLLQETPLLEFGEHVLQVVDGVARWWSGDEQDFLV